MKHLVGKSKGDWPEEFPRLGLPASDVRGDDFGEVPLLFQKVLQAVWSLGQLLQHLDPAVHVVKVHLARERSTTNNYLYYLIISLNRTTMTIRIIIILLYYGYIIYKMFLPAAIRANSINYFSVTLVFDSISTVCFDDYSSKQFFYFKAKDKKHLKLTVCRV